MSSALENDGKLNAPESPDTQRPYHVRAISTQNHLHFTKHNSQNEHRSPLAQQRNAKHRYIVYDLTVANATSCCKLQQPHQKPIITLACLFKASGFRIRCNVRGGFFFGGILSGNLPLVAPVEHVIKYAKLTWRMRS